MLSTAGEDGVTVLRGIAGELVGDEPALSDRIFVALRARVPDIDGLPADLLADVRGAMRRTVLLLLTAFADDTPLSGLREQVYEVAYRRASSGTISMQQTLLAYEVGAEELLDVITGRIAVNGSGYELIMYASRRLLRCLQLTTEAVAAAYQHAAAAAAVDSEQETTRYLEMLAGCRPVAPALMNRMAGIGRAGPFSWCVASVPLDDGGAELVRAVRAERGPVLAGLLDGRLVLLDAAPVTGSLPVTVGAAEVDRGIPEAVRRAAAAADLAAHLAVPRLDSAPHAALAAVLAMPAGERSDFVRARLGRLVEMPELLRTLTEYLRARGSVAQAARTLHVHRHTLDYRLEQIRQVAALDLDDPMTRLATELALFAVGRYP
jgi:hypothetical protein